MDDVYRQLATHLDNLPGGFPPTESGVELRILRRLFTPEEANIALGLTLMPEPVPVIAGRMGRDEASLGAILGDMSHKGLIFRMTKRGQTLFSAAQFVIGIWEYHLNDLDPDLIRDVNEYLPHLSREIWTKTDTKQTRVVPIGKTLSAEMTVTPYELAEEIIRQQSKIVVQPCICRREHRMVGKGCEYPMDVCLSFGSGAYYYEENGLGRPISQDEAIEVLRTAQEAGLVLQPGNAQRPSNFCMCCGCCCQILKNMKRLEQPAKVVHSNYFAEVSAEDCIACETCSERCHMDAITVAETAHVDTDRCIGCGVCVPSCPTEAMALRQKAEENRYVPPRNTIETYMRIGRERGKF
ncbi:MAG: 4Fe-4S binding protein [Desulfobacterales bacterium]